jgi:ribosomal protein S16
MAAKDLVEYVAKSLVDDPDAVKVDVIEEDGATPIELKVDEEKAKAWLAQGAQPSDTVVRLFKQAGIIPAGK